jgi:hypothetical protein
LTIFWKIHKTDYDYLFPQKCLQLKSILPSFLTKYLPNCNIGPSEWLAIFFRLQFSIDLFALFLLWPICTKMTVVAKASLKYLVQSVVKQNGEQPHCNV